MHTTVAGYALQNLSPYEQLQAREIEAWRHRRPSTLARLTQKAFVPVEKAVNRLIPKQIADGIIPLVESTTEHWTHDWDRLRRRAKIKDLEQLKQLPLQRCDHLAAAAEHRSEALAYLESGAGALLGVAGGLVGANLFLRMSVQTIHRIGLCYGYAPRTEVERQFAWSLLDVSMTFSEQDRKNALARLQDLQHLLYQQVAGELAAESIKTDVEDLTIETVAEALATRLIKLEGSEEIPGLGLALGLVLARETVAEVITAARSEFQLRWLLEHRANAS
jgi:hypothetical protein